MTGLSIAVVGAGTAGLASAILLARLGFRVRVLERVANLQPVGAGVLLQPSGLAALRELGLLAECTGLGAPVGRLYGTTACDGRVILDTRYDDWRVGTFGLGIHRAVLMTSLLDAAKQAGVRIETGVAISRFSQSAHSVELFVSDGRGGEQPYGECCALILADGVRSTLRGQMRVKQRVQPYPWGALWNIQPTPAGMQTTDLRQWYRGCREMFGVMPTGSTHLQRDQRLSSLFWSLPTAQFAAWREAGLDAWKKRVMQLTDGVAEPFLQAIESPAQLSFAAYADVRMQRWYDGRVLAIGDCAHAMSPQLGQGANMALVDAAALARALRPQRAAEVIDWERVFGGYTALRRQHLGYYRQASRLLTPLFQSNSRVLALLRDSALYLARHNRLGRYHAATTLVGARTGWLFGAYDEAALCAWRGTREVREALPE